MEIQIDELLGDLDQEVLIDDRIIDAAKSGDVDRVTQLLHVRDRRQIEAAVKRVSELQQAIIEKENERESFQRELAHLQEPVRVAAQSYAAALEALEQCQRDLAELQARQGVIDLGLQSRREELIEMRNQVKELMTFIGGIEK